MMETSVTITVFMPSGMGRIFTGQTVEYAADVMTKVCRGEGFTLESNDTPVVMAYSPGMVASVEIREVADV